jgi:hypothetical protein
MEVVMVKRLKCVAVSAMLIVFTCLLFAVCASAQERPPAVTHVNQTEGYGKDQLLVFTYLQNFMCIHEPADDLDNNGLPAAVDPAEFQTPHCAVGRQPGIGPDGQPIENVNKLYVIVPFFDADHDGEAASPGLAAALNSLFGFVPDAFDPHPGVAVQCPEPGSPRTTRQGAFGTCTMHPSTLDLGPVLAKLGKVPAGTNVVVPTPNHSHVIEYLNKQSQWWQIVSVLVTDQNVWPSADATSGITSVEALRGAQAQGKALGDVPTNFFLFFDSVSHVH